VRILPHHRDVAENHAMPVLLPRADVETIAQPQISEFEEFMPPVTVQPLRLGPVGFDAELEYELSAIGADEQRHPRSYVPVLPQSDPQSDASRVNAWLQEEADQLQRSA
jgi:hypothetical protein